MKKNFLIIGLISLVGFGASAQGAFVGLKIGLGNTQWYGNDVTTLNDTSEFKLLMGKGQTNVIKGDDEYEYINLNDPDGKISKRLGFHGGIQINSTISDYFWLKHEFVFATKGFKYKGTRLKRDQNPDYDPNDTTSPIPEPQYLYDTSDVDLRFRTYNIDIMPVSLCGHYEGLQLFFGPYISISLGGQWVDKTNSKVVAPGANDFVYVEDHNDAFQSDFDPKKSSRELGIVDFGFVAGFEYELPFGLNAGIRYVQGFGSVLETTEGESKTNAFNKDLRFSLGYTFGRE